MILHIKEADMDKFIYVEPAEYINDEMRRILERGAKEEAQKTQDEESDLTEEEKEK